MPNPSAHPVSPLVQRVFTWTGVVPLGGFLLVHLAINAFALRGAARFAAVLGAVHRMPGLGALEACFILLPLALHGALGVWLAATRRPLASKRPYSPNMQHAMRIAGIGVLVFLAMHLPEFRWRDAGERLGGNATATLLAADLSSTWQGMPWRGLAYLGGAACAAFHLGVGSWGMFASSSRGQSSSRARVAAAWGFGAASFAIWLGFANVVVMHATGAALFGVAPAAAEPQGTGPCPPSSVPH